MLCFQCVPCRLTVFLLHVTLILSEWITVALKQCVCAHTCACMHAHVCMHACMHACVRVHTHACVCVCVRMCVHVCVRVHVCFIHCQVLYYHLRIYIHQSGVYYTAHQYFQITSITICAGHVIFTCSKHSVSFFFIQIHFYLRWLLPSNHDWALKSKYLYYIIYDWALQIMYYII